MQEYIPTQGDPMHESWRWTRFPELNELGIWDMVQAADSSMWFSGNNGVIHYDGLSWKQYTHDHLEFSRYINMLCATRDNAVYAGSDLGLSVFHDHKWQRIYPGQWPYQRLISHITETRDGSVWLCTTLGLLRIHANTLTYYTIKAHRAVLQKIEPRAQLVILPDEFSSQIQWVNGAGVYAPRGVIHQLAPDSPAVQKGLQVGELIKDIDLSPKATEYQLVGEPGTALHILVQPNEFTLPYTMAINLESIDGKFQTCAFHTLFQDTDANFWIIAEDNKVIVCKPDENDGLDLHSWQTIHPPKDIHVSKECEIEQVSTGELWFISGENDPVQYNPITQNWKKSTTLHKKMSSGVSSLIETTDGKLWIGQHSQLSHLENNRWHAYTSQDIPLPSARLMLTHSHDGAIWIAGRMSDVLRIDYNTPQWTSYKGLIYAGETRSKQKWFITQYGDIVCQQNREWQIFSTEDGVIDIVMGIFITSRDELWAYGSHAGQAAVARFDGHVWHKKLLPQLSACIDYRAVCETTDGKLYFGAGTDAFLNNQNLGGMACLDGEKWTFYHPPQVHQSIVSIAETADKTIWFSGIRLDILKSQENDFHTPNELKTPWIDVLHTTQDRKNLWVGKGGVGLFHFNGDDWKHYTTNNGLAGNMITSLASDSLNRLWVATDKGISAFEPQTSWITHAFPENLKITREGGSLVHDPDGTLWINTVSLYWYKRFSLSSHSNQIYENFKTIAYKADNIPPETKIVNYSKEVGQPGNTTIVWNAVDPWRRTRDNDIQYAYRIDDEPWSDFSTETFHTFLTLPHGTHTIQVKSRDRDFNQDATPAIAHFRVIAPIWKQPWFIALVITFFATVIFYERQVRERNKTIHNLDMAKLRLFTNISHELRTPLTLIISPLERLLSYKKWDDRAKKQLELVHRNAQRLLRLVNQVMDFSKFESGSLKLNPHFGDICHFTRMVFTSFSPLAEEKELRYQYHAGNAEIYAWFDPDKMDKILFNLISNAVKYTPQGGTVEIHLDRNNDCISISIQDTGIGIPAEQQEHIFDRFYQVEDVQRHTIQGTGIGLTLVKELVEMHNGSITLQSEKDKGSTFTVTLPLNAGRDHTKTTEREPAKPQNVSIEKASESLNATILIIDDNDDIRSYLFDELKDSFDILLAANGTQGLEMAKANNPDLILSDVIMPEMDGLELCKNIKSHDETSHIPVILLTARSAVEHELKGMDMGADDYITKPFHIDVLQARIHNIIETRQRFRKRFSQEIKLEPKEITITSRDEDFLKRAIAIVEQYIDDFDFDVKLFAKEMHISYSLLHMKLKALTDQSATEFIRTIRLKRACDLLAKGYTVKETSFQVGFLDPSYFTRCFTKQFKKTPTQYAKENAASA